jgi:YD repeat-containing protein
MRDLDKLNLKGAVRSVVTRRETDSAFWSTYTFDREGALERIDGSEHSAKWPQTDLESEHSGHGKLTKEDGPRIKVDDVAGLSSWSMEPLHGVGFGTMGASIARTTLVNGLPVRTVFEDSDTQELASISYECDSYGRVTAAVLHSGAEKMVGSDPTNRTLQGTPFRSDIEAATATKGESIRATFEYNSSGLLTEWRTFILGQPVKHSIRTYNRNGDLLTVIEDDGASAVQFEYDYDSRGNWIRKTARHTLGTEVELRTISYYED